MTYIRSAPFQWIFVVLLFLLMYFNIWYNMATQNSKQINNAVQKLKDEIEMKFEKQVILEKQAINSNKSDDIVIIYNRVPKTGSTSFVGVVYDLCKRNKFHVLHINVTNNGHTLTLTNQIHFANNISYWNSIKPAFYHGHMAFLDFQKFGINHNPLYINLLRKPLDRFISYYYFLRYGDNFRPYLTRKKHGDTKTFDECVSLNLPDCDPKNMWLQIPFLCGHNPACWEVGNKWALEEAKRNLQKHYLLVGVTEDIPGFISCLETILPQIFKGASDIFIHNNKSHLRQTVQKMDPLPKTIETIKKTHIWQMENELYLYALNQYHATKKRLINASIQDSQQMFSYEKIRPK